MDGGCGGLALIRAAAVLAIAAMPGGCHRAEVRLPDGCHRTASGAPLFRISGTIGSFAGSDPRQFRVTAAADPIEVYPHFYLHDVGSGAGGSQWVAVATQPIRSGRFAVVWQGGKPAIDVPIEASGEVQAMPGKPC